MKNLPHLLCVDDDNKIRELLQIYLTNKNFRVSVARDSFEAEKLTSFFLFDLIILDITLPEMDGFQVLRKKSFKPPLSYLPNFSNPENKPSSYYSMITSFSFFTLGWVGYDWYMDRRSNYFTPKDELSPFPKNMFVFSTKEWIFNQAQPFIDPIYETKAWKWWEDRNKRKAERKRARRKSVFD